VSPSWPPCRLPGPRWRVSFTRRRRSWRRRQQRQKRRSRPLR
jgi:hypothetical protein